MNKYASEHARTYKVSDFSLLNQVDNLDNATSTLDKNMRETFNFFAVYIFVQCDKGNIKKDSYSNTQDWISC